jgi:hypothetical protein
MMVALQLPLWGKALSKYPTFLVNQGVGSVGVGRFSCPRLLKQIRVRLKLSTTWCR